jgi:hypothetical protein
MLVLTTRRELNFLQFVKIHVFLLQEEELGFVSDSKGNFAD